MDTICFDVFVDWMYEKTLPSCTETENVGLFVLTYIHMEELSIGGLKSILLNKFFDLLSDWHIPNNMVKDIFEDLPENDPLLRLTVDLFCINNGMARMSVEEFVDIDNLPKEYLARVLRKQHQLSELPEAERVLSREDYSMVVYMA